MTVNIYLHAPNNPHQLVDRNENGLEAALDDVRQHWNEEPSVSQLFWFTDEHETLLATMHRHPTDSERAITVYADGRVEQHQCEYLLDSEGHYEATEVRKIA